MNIKCALGIELKSIFASRNLNAKYTVMICCAQSVLARCIINTESLFPLSLSQTPTFLILDFPNGHQPRIVHLAEYSYASRNPVGKLIRSDNLEEFDVGLHPLAPVLFPPELIRAIYASDYR